MGFTSRVDAPDRTVYETQRVIKELPRFLAEAVG